MSLDRRRRTNVNISAKKGDVGAGFAAYLKSPRHGNFLAETFGVYSLNEEQISLNEIRNQLTVKPMSSTTEEPFKMKTEVLPSPHIALGEMQHVLSTILSTLHPRFCPRSRPVRQQHKKNSPTTLTTTIVSKPPQIGSVQTDNAQLVIGGKDDALRKATGQRRNEWKKKG
ncbi:hypothetical protein K435DRAFT_862804 [Dendrothele bispora CBS 962.96]|uniref:Uncharacterized protein n=1 Tax=Dendrothele bispora (strain CBS 962.96) TaxID=1314807 RepID=A0A4S8LRG6_DENBC|nr:hypothetical protein K435DRAFT_862804 [Dendrothele bispora CBS 962.96]